MSKYNVKVHRKGLIVLPKELRVKYGIIEGSDVVLIDEGGQIVLIPRSRLVDSYGIAKECSEVIDKIIEEIHWERRFEASS